MKKLMTMLSAAALAFGLRAADTGTSFEGMAAGPLDTASTIGELTPQEDGQSYWSATNENCVATVVVNPVNKRRMVNFDEELLVIFYSILNRIHEQYGFPAPIDMGYELITGKRCIFPFA